MVVASSKHFISHCDRISSVKDFNYFCFSVFPKQCGTIISNATRNLAGKKIFKIKVCKVLICHCCYSVWNLKHYNRCLCVGNACFGVKVFKVNIKCCAILGDVISWVGYIIVAIYQKNSLSCLHKLL